MYSYSIMLNETEWKSLVVEIYIVPLVEPNKGPKYNCNYNFL